MSQKLKSASVLDNDDAIIDNSNNKSVGDEIVTLPKSTIAIPTVEKEETIQFWTENPNALFDTKYILEFFPVSDMTYEQKLNAVTRTTIVLTILGFFYSGQSRVLIVGTITIFAIFLMFYYRKKEEFKTKSKLTEGFEDPAKVVLEENNIPLNNVFSKPSSGNPFSNVLLTDYDYNPNKKPAPPAFNSNINEDIITKAKKQIQDIHPDQPDITQKLYKDLGEELGFEQSMRQFNSNAITTIPNDQQSFAEFCYGSMVSCKEGNLFACARNKTNYTNY